MGKVLGEGLFLGVGVIGWVGIYVGKGGLVFSGRLDGNFGKNFRSEFKVGVVGVWGDWSL